MLRRTVLTAAATAALAGMAPAAAVADATITADHVAVRDAAGDTAWITRSPFHLAFQTPDGKVALSETTAAAGPAGSAEVDPEPLGTQNLPKSGVYAPLAYEVGGERTLQWPGATYQGDMLIGGHAGAIFSAQAVTAAIPHDGGAELTVTTNDPSGRTLIVDVTPDGERGFRVRATPSSTAGISAFGDSFLSGADEAFHGLGGRHIGLDQRGKALYGWIEQENFGPGSAQPLADLVPGDDSPHYMFPDGENAAYTVHDAFISSRGYGFLLNGFGLSRWRLDSDNASAWSVASADAQRLDYTVTLGTPEENAGALSGIEGRAPMPPEFAQEPAISQPVAVGGSYADGAANYQAAVEDDLSHIEAARLNQGAGGPTGAFAFEGWEGLGDAEDQTLVARIHKDGMHALGYVRAFVGYDGGAFDSLADWQTVTQNGYCAMTPAGAPYEYVEAGDPSCVIDFTNPAAVAWWRGRLFHMFDLGFDGFMQDFGEQVVADMRFHNGESGTTMHNRYPVIYHRVTARIMRDYERSHPGRELFDYTRSGFSGRHGSQAYSNGDFPGDENTDWSDQNGLPTVIPDMLNRGIDGSWGFNTDVGGYANFVAPVTTAELFDRWAEAAALMPYFRVHMDGGNPQMPWTVGGNAAAVYTAMAKLHEAALPLIRARWAQAERTGVPIEEPLWMAYPDDARAGAQQEEFLLGHDVLVAPVVTQGATTNSVYFPAGCWTDQNTGRQYTGPATATVPAGLATLPYFFACGTRPF